MLRSLSGLLFLFPLLYGPWVAEAEDMVTLSISDTSVAPGDSTVAIPILLKNETVPVRAVQIVLAYDPGLIKIVDFQKVDRTGDMDMVTYNVPSPGDLRVVIVDFGTDLIAPGSGAIATLFVDVSDSFSDTTMALTFVTEDGPGGYSTKVVGEDIQNLLLSVENGTLRIGGIAAAVIEREFPASVSLADTVAQNFPNPFNADTEIKYEISTSGPVSLKVYNVSGQMVRSLIEGRQKAGAYRVRWDGRDSLGSFVASGIYVYRLEGTNSAVTKKMVVLR